MKPLLLQTPVFLCAVALSLMLITACNDKITYVPVIESITVTPDTIVVGGTALIQLRVTDVDDKNLVYYYTATGGSITGNGDSVLWQAPDVTGVYLARVLVADKDGNQASDSIRLVVVKNDTSSQITGVAIFPSGTDLNLLDSKVRLFTSKDNWVNHIVFAQIKTEGFGPIVSFRFNNVPVGNYYLDIWKDTDYGNTINTGDYYGWFGRNDIITPDPEPFTIEAGATKVIPVQMWVIPAK